MGALHDQPLCALQLRVRGGLNNQRECLVNAVLMARVLGLDGLISPRVDLIGRGNEKFEPPGAQYVSPWHANTSGCASGLTRCPLSALFDEQLYANAAGVELIAAQRAEADAARVVMLASVEAATRCAGVPRFRETCAPPVGDRSIFRTLAMAWRQHIQAKAPGCILRPPNHTVVTAAAAGAATGAATGFKASTMAPYHFSSSSRRPLVVIDAGRSLCWNTFQSRDLNACNAIDAGCATIYRNLRSSAALSERERHVIKAVEAHVAGASWAAIHVRAFDCVPDPSHPPPRPGAPPTVTTPFGPSNSTGNQQVLRLGDLAAILRRSGVPPGAVYIVSSVAVAEVRAALHGTGYAAFGKEDFLGPSLRLRLPFEALAAIDFAVARAAPTFLGDPSKHSSFDAFVEALRAMDGRAPMVPIAETDYCPLAAAPPQPRAHAPSSNATV